MLPARETFGRMTLNRGHSHWLKPALDKGFCRYEPFGGGTRKASDDDDFDNCHPLLDMDLSLSFSSSLYENFNPSSPSLGLEKLCILGLRMILRGTRGSDEKRKKEEDSQIGKENNYLAPQRTKRKREREFRFHRKLALNEEHLSAWYH